MRYLKFLFLFCSFISAEIKILPYYSFQFGEGLTLPTVSDWFFSTNLTNDIGFIIKPEKHSILFLYELKYVGPGLERQEGTRFTDRWLDHIFFLQHQYKLKEILLKTRLNFSKEFQRTASNETWGLGLYDFNKYGLDFNIETEVFNTLASGTLSYNYFNFPNYTDLWTEYNLGGERAERVGGYQDYHYPQISVSCKKWFGKISISYGGLFYTQQKIVENTGYGSELQRDMIFLFNGETALLYKKFIFSPGLNLKLKYSNQNYLYFKEFGNIASAVFVPKYYDYQLYTIFIPVTFKLSETKSLFFNPEIEFKVYTFRPTRDRDGNFIFGQNQLNRSTILSVGYNSQTNKVFNWILYYTYYLQISNTEYEKYFPYNYCGHLFGLKLSFIY